MEIINENGLTIYKGNNSVVLDVTDYNRLPNAYDFIDGLIGKDYKLISTEPFHLLGNSKKIYFSAYLVK